MAYFVVQANQLSNKLVSMKDQMENLRGFLTGVGNWVHHWKDDEDGEFPSALGDFAGMAANELEVCDR